MAQKTNTLARDHKMMCGLPAILRVFGNSHLPDSLPTSRGPASWEPRRKLSLEVNPLKGD